MAERGTERPIRAVCDGVPVYGFGSCFVYGVSPDFVSGVELQEGSPGPARKIRPKKSWQISSNLIGASPPRLPRTELNDFQPQLAIRLIDGDPETFWSSRPQSRPDVEPSWIRIDLAREQVVQAVALRPRDDGKGFPGGLEIRVSRDAWHWQTVYDGPSRMKSPDALMSDEQYNIAMRVNATLGVALPEPPQPVVFSFDPRPVKQVWIIARELTPVYCGMYYFSAAEVEVRGESGDNLALASRGTGVTVSSTNYGFESQREMHEMLWPTFYDVGVKWIRCAFFGDILNWHGVEQEKGVYRIDERAEQALEECRAHGIKVMLGLGHTNWLYAGGRPVREAKQHWLTQEPPYGSLHGARGNLPPTTVPGMLEGFVDYVRFVVRHFTGRVHGYEIWNEENVCWNDENENLCPRYFPSPKDYVRWFTSAHAVIREEDPGATISLGGMCPSVYCTNDTEFLERVFAEGLAPLVDIIAWHGPFIAATPDRSDYAQTRIFEQVVARTKSLAEAAGFRGEYHINEWGASAPYPRMPGQFPEFTELTKAKYVARWSLLYHKLGIVHSWCDPWNEQQTVDPGWFRSTFSGDPMSPQQPEAAYYVMRTLCTALEAVRPEEFPVELSNRQARLSTVGLATADGDRILAIWQQERAADDGVDAVTDLAVDAVDAVRAVGVDVLNGTERDLRCVRRKDSLVVPGLRVRDWPVLVRFERRR